VRKGRLNLTAREIGSLRMLAYSLSFGEVRHLLWRIIESAESELRDEDGPMVTRATEDK
jgi:hypothetical protein